jgi:hypothetical protein
MPPPRASFASIRAQSRGRRTFPAPLDKASAEAPMDRTRPRSRSVDAESLDEVGDP